MKRYIFYRDYERYFVNNYLNSDSYTDSGNDTDLLITFLETETGLGVEDWIKELADPYSKGMGGNIIELEKDNEMVSIYSHILEPDYSSSFKIKAVDLIHIIKEWIKIKKSLIWDEIIVEFDEKTRKVTFQGRMFPKDRTIIFYRGLNNINSIVEDENGPDFYNVINPVYGIINDLKVFLIREIQKNPDKWIKFLSSEKLDYLDSHSSHLEKIENNIVLICSFARKVRIEQDVESYAIDRVVLLDLVSQWIALTKVGYKKIILELKDGVHTLRGEF